jgi:LacI family transcriptional regulator
MSARRPVLGLFLRLHGPYYDQLRQGIAAYHQLHGDWEFAHESDQLSVSELRRLKGVDGVIAVLGDARPPAEGQLLSDELIRLGVPVLDASPGRLDDRPFPQVHADDVAVGRAAAEYFITLGFSTFGFVGLPLRVCRQRLRGFQEALAMRGFACLLPPEIPRWWDPAARSAVEKQWFKDTPKPIAVLAVNDFFAGGALASAKAEGILIPEQVALMGIDNSFVCDLFRPSLTSIPLDGVRAGYEAARLMHQMLQGQPAPRSVAIPPLPIVPRGSTDTMAIADRDVIAAVRYIRDHAAAAISTDQICRHISVSRRKLEKRFQVVLHRTIGDEIRRVQTRRAMELLRVTSLSIEDVAEKSGFGSAAAFSRIFKRVIGCSPTEYRHRSVAHSGRPTARRR